MLKSLFTFLLIETFLLCNCSGQLAPSDPSIYDGPCNFPQQLALNTNVPSFYNPGKSYYVPLANKVFRRAQYEIVNSESATTQAQLDSLKPRVHIFGLTSLLSLADMTITFKDGFQLWYNYRCLPSNPLEYNPENVFAPLLNLTCSVPDGSSTVERESQVGLIYYSVIWSDDTAFTCWGCINGRQIFHIMSTNSTLTQAQLSANVDLLTPLGFNVSNYESMLY